MISPNFVYYEGEKVHAMDRTFSGTARLHLALVMPPGAKAKAVYMQWTKDGYEKGAKCSLDYTPSSPEAKKSVGSQSDSGISSLDRDDVPLYQFQRKHGLGHEDSSFAWPAAPENVHAFCDKAGLGEEVKGILLGFIDRFGSRFPNQTEGEVKEWAREADAKLQACAAAVPVDAGEKQPATGNNQPFSARFRSGLGKLVRNVHILR